MKPAVALTEVGRVVFLMVALLLPVVGAACLVYAFAGINRGQPLASLIWRGLAWLFIAAGGVAFGALVLLWRGLRVSQVRAWMIRGPGLFRYVGSGPFGVGLSVALVLLGELLWGLALASLWLSRRMGHGSGERRVGDEAQGGVDGAGEVQRPRDGG